jgi:hypothetical protein
METVELACHTNFIESDIDTNLDRTVEWRILNASEEKGFNMIYASSGIRKDLEETGRYKISVKDGFYNLSISNVTFDEAGEYVCVENGGTGNKSVVRLNVTS